MTDAPLPAALAEIAEDFQAMSASDRLQLLLEFSDGLPALPERYAGHLELMEQVEECQSPLFLVVEVDQDRRRRLAEVVNLFFDAPPAAPTTRGFAGILHAGLDGLSAGRAARRAGRRAVPVRAGRGRQPAAAARHGLDARPDQASGPGQGRGLSRRPGRPAP